MLRATLTVLSCVVLLFGCSKEEQPSSAKNESQITPTQPAPSTPPKDASPPSVQQPILDTDAAKRLAEKKASEWFTAVKQGDGQTLVRLSAPPFYFDSEVLASSEDIAAKYQNMLSKPRGNDFRIDTMKSGEVGEFKKHGWITANDRIYANLSIKDDDMAVGLGIKGEGVLLVFRRAGPNLELAGFWD